MFCLTLILIASVARFGKCKEFIGNLENTTKNKVIHTIVDAEPFATNKKIDALVIAPCTGNTLSKLANGLTDSAVTMSAKALLRNNKPIVIGVSTNDGLGASLKNIAELLNGKNFYFVPFRQDNFENKPKSLVADWSMVEDTVLLAAENKQIQPILI